MTYAPPSPIYEKPTLEVLGSFAALTQHFNPGKWQSASDLSQSIIGAINDGGPGYAGS